MTKLTLITENNITDDMTKESYYRMANILQPLCDDFTILAVNTDLVQIPKTKIIKTFGIFNTLKQLLKIESIYMFWYGGGLKVGMTIIILKLLKPNSKIIMRIDGNSSFMYKERLKSAIPFKRKLSYLRLYLMHKMAEILIYSMVNIIAYQYEGLVEDYKISKYSKKLKLANQYVDTKQFYNITPFDDRKYQLGYFGRLDEAKGIKQLLNALQYIKGKHGLLVSLLLVGDGELLDYAYQFAINNAINVKVIGRVASDQIPKYMNQIRYMILPSFKEGLPKVVIESMSCGCIPITSGVGGLKYLVKNNGYLIDSIDTIGISSAILQSLTNSDKVDKYLIKYPAILEWYSLKNTQQRYKEILDCLVK